MFRRVREDILDDSFGKPAGALILLHHDANAASGLDVRSSGSVHVSTRHLRRQHFFRQPAGIPHAPNALRVSEFLFHQLHLALI
jgi:hypothetical protein